MHLQNMTPWAIAIKNLSPSNTKNHRGARFTPDGKFAPMPPTEYDIEEVKKYFPIMATADIARKIFRTDKFVRDVAGQIGVKKIFQPGKPTFVVYLDIVKRHKAGQMIDQIAAAKHLNGMIVHKAIQHFKEYGIDG